MKIEIKKVISCQEWDKLVSETYGRPYCFQQQDDCKPRGVESLTVPSEYTNDYEEDTVPEIVNHPEMGVSFKAWLERDPKELIPDDDKYRAPSWKPTEDEIKKMRESSTLLWWERNFYPDVNMVANDLYEKGLLEAGEYLIRIDW